MMFNEWPYDVCLAYICRQTLTPSSTWMRTGRVRIVWVQSSHVRGRAGEVDKFKRPWVGLLHRPIGADGNCSDRGLTNTETSLRT